MMARLSKALGALPARQLHLIGGGLLLALAASLWMAGLRAPLTQLRAVRAEHQRLETGGADPRLLAAQLAQLDADVKTVSARLGLGDAHPAPATMLVTLVGDVNRLALAHGITVNAVTPSQNVQTMVFNQVGFELDASGSYRALLAWMSAIEATQVNIAIAGFDMEPAKTPGQIHIRIRIAAYRPQEVAP
ncbi:MAG: type 4a pilus biogenesis protein PilO [Pseudomonadota bacterium]|nr:type 4a pilus biogenesis protein PilO [Pseudomonadota bacterium]